MNGKLIPWILGLLGAMILGAGSAIVTQGQKIAALETDAGSVKTALARIESKVDRLIERGAAPTQRGPIP